MTPLFVTPLFDPVILCVLDWNSASSSRNKDYIYEPDEFPDGGFFSCYSPRYERKSSHYPDVVYRPMRHYPYAVTIVCNQPRLINVSVTPIQSLAPHH